MGHTCMHKVLLDLCYFLMCVDLFHAQGARVGIGAVSYQGNDYFASMTLLAPVVFVAHAVAPLLLSLRASNLGGVSFKSYDG